MTYQHADQISHTICSSVVLQQRSLVTAVEILGPSSIAISSANVSPYVWIYSFGGTEIAQCVGHTKDVWSLSAVGDTLVSGGTDTTIMLWDAHSGASRGTLYGHTGTIRCLQTLDTDTGRFLSASRDGTVRLWSTEGSQCEKTILAHDKGVRCLNHMGGITASGGYDRRVRLWNVSEEHCLQTFEGHSATVSSIVFDSTKLAAGAEDGEVRVWDRASGTVLASLNTGLGIPAQVRVCNETLVSTGANGSITFWNKSWLRIDHTILAHDGVVVALCTTNSALLTGGLDGLIKNWDPESGQVVQEMTARYKVVRAIAFGEGVVVVVSTDNAHTALEGLRGIQLNLNDILHTAIAVLPEDALAQILLMDHDMYEDDDDDFACGRAYGGSHVCVVSSYRYNPFNEESTIDREHIWPASHCASFLEKHEALFIEAPKRKRKRSPARTQKRPSVPLAKAIEAHKTLDWKNRRTVASHWLSRVCRTASHELGHCLGMDHCMYYACIMQGTASVSEDLRQPPYLCPVDEAKVCNIIAERGDAVKGSTRSREQALLEFTRKHPHGGGFAAFCAWLEERLAPGE